MDTNKIIAWGDIHGHYRAAHAAIEKTIKLGYRAVFLGDYIDRGPESIITLLRLIMAKENNPDWVFLRGNHEQVILPFLQEEYDEANLFNVLDFDTYSSFYEFKLNLREKMLEFLSSTSLYYETDSYVFTHAPLKDYACSLDEVDEDELVWNYDTTPVWKGKTNIHGHQSVSESTFSFNGININTACGSGGYLTGIILSETPTNSYQVIQLNEDGKLTKEYFLDNLHLIKYN